MRDKYYDHYMLLSKENLIKLIEEKDLEIKNMKCILEEIRELKDKYYTFNKFHMEEITRLDKIIGTYRKQYKLTI